eukprot:9151800-Lingulodinium_polyedra.AAC.1
MSMRPLKAQGLSAFLAVLGVLVTHALHAHLDWRHAGVRHSCCPYFPLFPFADLGLPTADV